MADHYFAGHRFPTADERRRYAPQLSAEEEAAALSREFNRVITEGMKFWRSLRIDADGRFTTRPR
jgi:hypothetical protein